MDTRLKKFKYSRIFKWSVAVLMLISIFLASFYGIVLFSGLFTTGENYLTGKKITYMDYNSLPELISNDMSDLNFVVNNISQKQEIDKEVATQMPSFDDVKEKFLSGKATIIYEELTYSENNYKSNLTSYDESMNTATYYDEDSNETSINYGNIPQDFKVVKKGSDGESITYNVSEILRTYASDDPKLVEYEHLVRKKAFTERDFEFSSHLNVSYNLGQDFYIKCDYSYTLDDLENNYDSRVVSTNESVSAEFSSVTKSYKKSLDKLVNVKYVVFDKDRSILDTNIKDFASKNYPDTSKYKNVLIVENKNVQYKGDFTDHSKTVLDDFFKNSFDEQQSICVYMNNTLVEGDRYFSAFSSAQLYENISFKKALTNTLLYLAVTIVLSLILFSVCGVVDEKKTRHYLIDKIPSDIHFALTMTITICSVILGFFILVDNLENSMYYNHDLSSLLLNIKTITYCTATLIAISYALMIEFICSLLRRYRSGLKIIKGSLWYKILRFFAKKFVALFHIIFYRCKSLRRIIVPAVLVLGFLNFFFIFLAFDSRQSGYIIPLMIVDFAALIYLLRYISALDKIIYSAKMRFPMTASDTMRMPPLLRDLAQSLQVTQDELNARVENALKNERTKTQLITNVSHDLKTPLTSIISYVDLLKTCDIDNEDALSYINILEDKSSRLKKLIEDLIETSKVTSGNVKLVKTQVNLTELINQAIGEMQEDFESRNLTLCFNQPEESPILFADSQKTWRVIENLMSNAYKYSAPGTRIYLDVSRSADFGILSIKNVSDQQLNIDPSELTERFVRGDESRSEVEGSGLGLSIAKDLCRLQGGSLSLQIDGDLFKATVALPIMHNNFYTPPAHPQQQSPQPQPQQPRPPYPSE